MMLPQHKEQSLRQAQEWKKRKRPTIDAQEQERILQEIGQALQGKTTVTLTLFEEYEDRVISGVPVSYSQHRKTLRMEIEGEPEWIHFDDIISAAGPDYY
ncbi:YolD-like family protein [Paenibacillus sp. HJGM_3]|uniref:YolD-like family protein n=1 Tax=Paenibacillus sp. HJGM_3 TaxID=3379816 RepID=UPI00385F03EC